MVAASPQALAKSFLENASASAHSMKVGFIAGLVTVMAMALLCCLLRRKLIIFPNKGKRNKSFKCDKISLRRFDLEEIKKATNNFSQDCLLGSGAFGNVYKGTFDIEGTLAIKRAHFDSLSSVEDFRNEVRLLSKVTHKNLVGLVGYCEEPKGDGVKILVYEYVPNGSLLQYMMGRRGKSLTWRQRVKIAIGAARGIAYLHEGVKPSIIHRDIKPSDILIGEMLEAKVSDFGLVRTGPSGDQSHVSSQIKGTPGYLDPAYCSSFHLTTFSDVFSFGVVLLQLVSARPVVDTSQNQSAYHIIDWARPSLERGKVEDIIDVNLLTEPCNMKVMLKMGQLALKCVVQVPKHRPTMNQVCQELEEALHLSGNFTNHHFSKGFSRSIGSYDQSKDSEPLGSSVENYDHAHSFVSMDKKFYVDNDTFSFQSTSLRCLENNSINIDVDESTLRRTRE